MLTTVKKAVSCIFLYDRTNSLERDVLKSVRIIIVDSINIENKSGRKIKSPRTMICAHKEEGASSVAALQSSLTISDFIRVLFIKILLKTSTRFLAFNICLGA